jgi:hypothetical protein
MEKPVGDGPKNKSIGFHGGEGRGGEPNGANALVLLRVFSKSESAVGAVTIYKHFNTY